MYRLKYDSFVVNKDKSEMDDFEKHVHRYYNSNDGCFLFADYDLCVTRYNSWTFQELERFKESNMMNDKTLYTCEKHMASTICPTKILFVMEMNNTTNKIMGFGLVKNFPNKNKYNIHEETKYNQVTYKSNYHIHLNQIQLEDHEAEFIENIFEKTLFYGKSNLKRGKSTIMKFPDSRLKFSHLMFVLTLFMRVNPNNFNETFLCKKSKYKNKNS